jgi:hypothetical protein
VAARSIIYWECRAKNHRALASRHGVGGLTINEGSWAYCDGAGSDDAHDWSATGGVALESLVRWAAPAARLDVDRPVTSAARARRTTRAG